MLSHEKLIMRIGCYLLDTCKCSIIYKPDITKGLEYYVNTDFMVGWSQANADNAENILSKTGYVIMYANCPILWVSRLQTEIARINGRELYVQPFKQSMSVQGAISTMRFEEQTRVSSYN
jgi:hypothetical protein